MRNVEVQYELSDVRVCTSELSDKSLDKSHEKKIIQCTVDIKLTNVIVTITLVYLPHSSACRFSNAISLCLHCFSIFLRKVCK